MTAHLWEQQERLNPHVRRHSCMDPENLEPFLSPSFPPTPYPLPSLLLRIYICTSASVARVVRECKRAQIRTEKKRCSCCWRLHTALVPLHDRARFTRCKKFLSRCVRLAAKQVCVFPNLLCFTQPYAVFHSLLLFLQGAIAVGKELSAEVQGKNVYISVDLDALDPAFAPGRCTQILAIYCDGN